MRYGIIKCQSDIKSISLYLKEIIIYLNKVQKYINHIQKLLIGNKFQKEI